MRSKKAIITVIEMSLLVLLLGGVIIYTYSNPVLDQTLQQSVESFTSSLSNSEYSRFIILEDLSTQTHSQNWTSLQKVLDSSFSEYELIISNSSHFKKIFACNPKYSKLNAQSIVSIYNNTVYDFRTITLGVCY